MISDELLNAYIETNYFINNIEMPLKINKYSDFLNDIYNKYSVNSCAYITAYNPYSKQVDEYENIKNIATFENNWIFNLKIKSFDLVIPIQSIIFNNFNDINLIDLNQLKIHYINNKNNSLIQLIDKIIDRINILEADK